MALNLNIKWYTETDSTNNLALKEGDSNPDMTIWAAEYQTAGRGQVGNKWSSKRGENLTFSILLKPKFVKAKEQFTIAIITTLGIYKYLKNKLEPYRDKGGEEIKIKWPNDIYVGDKKICGILIEHSIMGENISQSIVGIGLNINQISFPKELKNPTSLLKEINRRNCKHFNVSNIEKNDKQFEIKEELKEVAKEIFKYYKKAEQEWSENGNFNTLYKEYIDCLYRYNEWHYYTQISDIAADKAVETILQSEVEDLKAETGNRIFKGRIIGITSQACLIIETEQGEEKHFAFKELGYII